MFLKKPKLFRMLACWMPERRSPSRSHVGRCCTVSTIAGAWPGNSENSPGTLPPAVSWPARVVSVDCLFLPIAILTSWISIKQSSQLCRSSSWRTPGCTPWWPQLWCNKLASSARCVVPVNRSPWDFGVSLSLLVTLCVSFRHGTHAEVDIGGGRVGREDGGGHLLDCKPAAALGTVGNAVRQMGEGEARRAQECVGAEAVGAGMA